MTLPRGENRLRMMCIVFLGTAVAAAAMAGVMLAVVARQSSQLEDTRRAYCERTADYYNLKFPGAVQIARETCSTPEGVRRLIGG